MSKPAEDKIVFEKKKKAPGQREGEIAEGR